ncbi:MAG TPA: hypothetical protein VLT33_04035, partial [Labilithrix sp.]|nr:hypothetical protein [Labilithrix sp.]
GKMCGGIAGIRCRAGLTCKRSGPNHPDASGICSKPTAGEDGAPCGGTAALKCKSGFTCNTASAPSSGPPPGAVGLPAPAPTGKGPPPGAVGLPMPASGTCEAVHSGPPPGAVGLPQPHK